MPSNDERLLAAALDCFVLYGVRKTTLEDVAARAGVSRSSVYRALGTKARLTVRVAEAEVDRFLRELSDALPVRAPLAPALTSLVDFALDWLPREPFSRRVLCHEPEIVVSVVIERPGTQPLIPLVAARLGKLLEERTDTGQLRVSPAHAAEWLVRIVLSVLLAPSGALVDSASIVDQLVRGLGASGAPESHTGESHTESPR